MPSETPGAILFVKHKQDYVMQCWFSIVPLKQIFKSCFCGVPSMYHSVYVALIFQTFRYFYRQNAFGNTWSHLICKTHAVLCNSMQHWFSVVPLKQIFKSCFTVFHLCIIPFMWQPVFRLFDISIAFK